MTTAKAGFVANPTAGNWERETLEKLVFATIKERRAARRWSIFFRLAFLAVVVVGLWTYLDLSLRRRRRKPRPPHRVNRN